MKKRVISRIRLIESGSESSFKNRWEKKRNFEKFLASKKTFRVWQWLTASGATFRENAKRSLIEECITVVQSCILNSSSKIYKASLNMRVDWRAVVLLFLFCCWLSTSLSINKEQISLFGLTFVLCKSVVWVSRLCVSSQELKTPEFYKFPTPKIWPQNISYRG